MKKDNSRGSITLEACIVVPMFIILMLAVNGFFIMFMGNQIMSHTLIQSAKSMALDPYSTQRSAANGDDSLAETLKAVLAIADSDHSSNQEWYSDDEYDQAELAQLAKTRFIAYLHSSEAKAANLLEVIGVENGIDGLDFSESTLEDGVLTIKIKYVQEFLLNAGGLTSFERELGVKVNLFEYKSM